MTTIANLAQIPIALNYLSAENFGIWVALTGLFQFMGFADFGIGLGVQNKISNAYAANDFRRVQELTKTAFALLSSIGLIVALIAITLKSEIIGNVFPKNAKDLGHNWDLLYFAVIACFALNLPLGMGGRLSIGLQQAWLSSTWGVVSSLGTLIVVLIAATIHLDFNTFVVATLSTTIFSNIGLLISAVYRHSQPRHFCMARLDAAVIPAFIRAGSLFLLPQICSTAVNTLPSIILSLTLGPAAVAPYAIVNRIQNAALQMQQIPLQSLWPAITEATARADIRWVKGTIIRGFLYALLSGVLGAGIYGCYLDAIVRLWLGNKSLNIPTNLIVASSIWLGISCITGFIALYLNAISRLRSQAIGNSISTVLAFSIMSWQTQINGPAGIYWSLLIGFICFGWPIMATDFAARVKTLKQ